MSEERLCLGGNTWAGYDRTTGDGDSWEFIDTHYTDYPETAARVLAAMKWRSGTHFILVVSPTAAYEYSVTLDTSGPTFQIKEAD